MSVQAILQGQQRPPVLAHLGYGYGVCTTPAATAAKTVDITNYDLNVGGIVCVKFNYNVPANATLNINNRGAKAIYYRSSAITANIITAGDLATLMYDGSHYNLISMDIVSGDSIGF